MLNAIGFLSFQGIELFIFYLYIGNVLSIFVLSCPEMRSNFNQLLIGLASFDLLYLLVSLMLFAFPKLSMGYTMNVLPHVMPIG